MDFVLLLTSSLFFVLPLLIFYYKHRNNSRKLPPGNTGWPIIGESYEFISTGKSGRPDTFFKKRMNKYSLEIFKTSIAGEKVVVLCGASGNKFLFSNENNLVVSWFPPSIEKIINPLTTSTKIGFRKILVEFLNTEALKKYIPMIDSSTRNQMQREWVSREVKVLPFSANLTFFISCKLFMNIENHLLITEFADYFKKLGDGIFSVPVNFPGTTYNRALKAANVLRDRVLPIIKERIRVIAKKSSSEFQDLLSKFITWTDEDGKFVSENEIATLIWLIFLASHGNTSKLITLVVYYLVNHPHVYAQVVQEQMEILKSKQADEFLNWDDIQMMKYSRNVVNEVLRLEPISPGSFKHVINDFTYANFSIPKGWKIFWSVHTTHKDSKYFEDPEKFDPTRFERKVLPGTFIPFGGGSRICPGREFARIVVLIFMHRLVTTFKIDKIIPNETIIYTPSPIPDHGLPIKLSPRQT